MSYILHIGPHKTGSSYLQRELYENYDVLMSHGIYYPRNEWIKGGHGHAGLLDERRLDELAPTMDKDKNENSGIKNILISSENFDRLNLKQISDLKNQIGSNVMIVYYTRRFDRLLFSNWQENVKFGSGETFQFFLLKNLATPFSSKIINHCLVLDDWSKVFGKDNIKILDYDAITEAKDNVFSIFCREILKINNINEVSIKNEKLNASFSLEKTELLRLLHLITDSQRKGIQSDISKLFYKWNRENKSDFEQLQNRINITKQSIQLSAKSFVSTVHHHFVQNYNQCFVTPISKFNCDPIEVIDESLLLKPAIRATLRDILKRSDQSLAVNIPL